MLQQTQVQTVLRYFPRFVEAFPDVHALATAEESEVLRLWEGLGYYRRARQMHRAARILSRELGGRFPRDVESLCRLPGIGRYTAGAILSIAFELPVPILEANTKRLFARLLGYARPVSTAAAERAFWQAAQTLVPQKRPGEFNQALMELGSLVCLPAAPHCDACPVARWCEAHKQGREGAIPVPAVRTETIARHDVAFVVRNNASVLLVRYGNAGHWAGLWDFPRITLQEPASQLSGEKAAQLFRQQFGLDFSVTPQHQHRLRHAVTRYRIVLDCFETRIDREPSKLEWLPSQDSIRGDPEARIAEMAWASLERLGELPFSSTGRKICRLLDDGDSTNQQ